MVVGCTSQKRPRRRRSSRGGGGILLSTFSPISTMASLPLLLLLLFVVGVCCAFTPPSSKFTTSTRPSFLSSSLQALPIDEIISSATTATTAVTDHLSSTSTIQLASSQVLDVIEQAEANEPMLASLLHIPTLWSVLAMTSIVALLVAWEESIE